MSDREIDPWELLEQSKDAYLLSFGREDVTRLSTVTRVFRLATMARQNLNEERTRSARDKMHESKGEKIQLSKFSSGRSSRLCSFKGPTLPVTLIFSLCYFSLVRERFRELIRRLLHRLFFSERKGPR